MITRQFFDRPSSVTIMSKEPDTLLDECQDSLGYRFRRPELLRAALTHTSGANTRLMSNERLEFLGDSVLGLLVCERLYHRFPHYQEGAMTLVKSAVVSGTTCQKFMRHLGVGQYLILGRGMPTGDHLPANVLANAFESILGAIYLDGDIEAARIFCLGMLDKAIDAAVTEARLGSAKTEFQTYCQQEFGKPPVYRVLDEQGPEHSRVFRICASVGVLNFPAAWGRTKKQGEAHAAANALASIRSEPIPHAEE